MSALTQCVACVSAPTMWSMFLCDSCMFPCSAILHPIHVKGVANRTGTHKSSALFLKNKPHQIAWYHAIWCPQSTWFGVPLTLYWRPQQIKMRHVLRMCLSRHHVIVWTGERCVRVHWHCVCIQYMFVCPYSMCLSTLTLGVWACVFCVFSGNGAG